MENAEIEAIIKLIDDPDPKVYNDIYDFILNRGSQFLPFLENSWSFNDNPEFQSRVQYLIDTIQINEVGQSVLNWKNNTESELLDLLYIIESVSLLYTDFSELRQSIKKLNESIWLDLNNGLTSIEKIKIINNHFFINYELKPANLLDISSLQLSRVTDTKLMHPLSLSLLYLWVCNKNGLNVKIIHVPEIVLLAYFDEITASIAFATEQHHNIVFFIDPSQQGAIIGRQMVDQYIDSKSFEIQPDFFVPFSKVGEALVLVKLYIKILKGERKKDLRLALFLEIEKQLEA
jgi:hypothetical protein